MIAVNDGKGGRVGSVDKIQMVTDMIVNEKDVCDIRSDPSKVENKFFNKMFINKMFLKNVHCNIENYKRYERNDSINT